MEADTRRDVLLMYMYKYTPAAGGKTAHRWAFVPDAWKPGDELPDFVDDIEVANPSKLDYWTTNTEIAKGARPGQVFKFGITGAVGEPDTTLHFNKGGKHAEYQGSHSDVKLVMYCHARNRQYDAENRVNKEGKLADTLKDLDGVRAAYKRLTAPARAQLLALVVNYITH